MSMDYIELTTLLIAIIGVCIIIVKAINKNTNETVGMREDLRTFKVSCDDKFTDINEDLETHEKYLVEYGQRITKIERGE